MKLKILFEIARALNYLHSLNPPIIHRDIKPLNIFIDEESSAKIGDFGLAIEYDNKLEANINTDTFSTLEYMSPEVLKQGIYRPESDIYSFGVLMYELLSESSFMKKDQFDLINNILEKQHRPSLKGFESSLVLNELIQQCW